MVKIALEDLSSAARDAIIESFVLREGTDYGEAEHDLVEKCLAVRRQLEAGDAEIDFDPRTDTIDIRRVGKLVEK